MAYLNALAALSIIILGTYYARKGRRVDKWVMICNVIAGVWVLIAYSMIFYDSFIKDIFTPAEITCFVIRPAIFVLLTTKIANMIRIGRRDD